MASREDPDPRLTQRWSSADASEVVLSGTGARAAKDGCEALASAFNASNIPAEAQEANHPILVVRFALIGASAGPGKQHGGCGVRRDMRFLATEGKFTNLTDRQRFAPYGLFGGRAGAKGGTVINPGPDEQVVPSKDSRELAHGDVISFQQPGAGGYGNPLDRDPARVTEDVLDEYVSLAQAREAYGVVIGLPTLTVDHEATVRLRASRRRTAPPPVVTRS